MEIGVIGCGPAGSYTAHELAQTGYDVTLYDKKKDIGKPIQCTGILSDKLKKFLKPHDSFIENTVNRARIYAPNGEFIDSKIKKNYVVCRTKLDNYLVQRALNAGAKLKRSHSFKKYEQKKILFKTKNKYVTKKAEMIIGADGPLSMVAKSIGCYQNRKHIIGSQIETKMDNDGVVEFYPYIGCYSWIVPKNEKIVRIGVADYKNSISKLKEFVKEKTNKKMSSLTSENQSGIIPLFNPRINVLKRNVYLNGDAATFTKSTTGGGIIPSFKGARLIKESLEQERNYQTLFKRKLHRKLHTHLILHKMMRKFRNHEWIKLISEFKKEELKKILYNESRDEITKMLIKIGKTSPKMFAYMKHFPLNEVKNMLY